MSNTARLGKTEMKGPLDLDPLLSQFQKTLRYYARVYMVHAMSCHEYIIRNPMLVSTWQGANPQIDELLARERKEQ